MMVWHEAAQDALTTAGPSSINSAKRMLNDTINNPMMDKVSHRTNCQGLMSHSIQPLPSAPGIVADAARLNNPLLDKVSQRTKVVYGPGPGAGQWTRTDSEAGLPRPGEATCAADFESRKAA